jgi:hypothetical protein
MAQEIATDDGILWIGGTSALARTYFDEVVSTIESPPSSFIVTGVENSIQNIRHSKKVKCTFAHLNLASKDSVQTFFTRISKIPLKCTRMIISVRQPLVAPITFTTRMVKGSSKVAAANDLNDYHLQLGSNLALLINLAADYGIRAVLHISSVAVVDHLRDQIYENEDHPMPDINTYKGSYDIFKRHSEEVVIKECSLKSIHFTNLRIGAIFSNDTSSCIQCSALRLLSWPISSYVSTKIDCNSSRNVGVAIQLILDRFQLLFQETKNSGLSTKKELESRTPTSSKVDKSSSSSSTTTLQLAPVYYYTCPSLQGSDPWSYGDYLVAYRTVFEVSPTLWFPWTLSRMFMTMFHFIASSSFAFCLFQWIGFGAFVQSLDYLLQVSRVEVFSLSLSCSLLLSNLGLIWLS